MTFTDCTVKPGYCRIMERETLRVLAAAGIDFREVTARTRQRVRLEEYDPALQGFLLAWERRAGAARAEFFYQDDSLLLCAMLARPPGRRLLSVCARQAARLWRKRVDVPSGLSFPCAVTFLLPRGIERLGELMRVSQPLDWLQAEYFASET
jgi:hypothetical protein